MTLVYYGQTVGRVKMKRGMELGIGPGHIVLDGDPAPLPNRGGELDLWDVVSAPDSRFRPMSIVAKRLPISANAEHLLNI